MKKEKPTKYYAAADEKGAAPRFWFPLFAKGEKGEPQNETVPLCYRRNPCVDQPPRNSCQCYRRTIFKNCFKAIKHLLNYVITRRRRSYVVPDYAIRHSHDQPRVLEKSRTKVLFTRLVACVIVAGGTKNVSVHVSGAAARSYSDAGDMAAGVILSSRPGMHCHDIIRILICIR